MQSADNDNNIDTEAGEIPRKPLSPAAKRALAEAEERRQAQEAQAQAELPTEIGGRGGADPARFGDWEINGRAIDF
ncbi:MULTISPECIES: DUF1674 domain-containing protein [unclassified Rhizobium]|uniref:DUF1674 domain-containing protein n=1 Tax=unclassified Rhizobium TaxID=2613769 RepID=UPI000EA88722|nr:MULTISPECIES: DUF1674 domain-containing protein [unclassified Rhizobium]AYG67970.1 DUF1674 domain-containing protein [Rhizobium sp. CCGE531]AYG74360.1 DUF1674 domain-containing protein [Rhizobium sp. CCGE532]